VSAARVVAITGASRGIGRLLAAKLGAQGASVVVNYKTNAELAEQSLADVVAAGGNGFTVQADIEQPEEIDRMFEAVRDRYGRLDAFVANAAASVFKPVSGLKQHHLDRSYAMNTRSFVLGANRAGRAGSSRSRPASGPSPARGCRSSRASRCR
jgi:NAD(P)-dependent dehydrogenase (short-subunit alcohol dehydrogenase family)